MNPPYYDVNALLNEPVTLLTDVEASCNIPHEDIMGRIDTIVHIHIQCIHDV